MIQFLFRKRGRGPQCPSKIAQPPPRLWRRLVRGKKERIQSTQWTDRLAGLVDSQSETYGAVSSFKGIGLDTSDFPHPRINVALRLEGPYFSPADPSRYDKVVCFVAGTGISGGIAIANAFTALQSAAPERSTVSNTTEDLDQKVAARLPAWRRCIVVWSVKETDIVDLPFIETCKGLEVRTCLTGPRRARIDMAKVLEDLRNEDPGGSTWVYISGPGAFLEAGKSACRAATDVEYYAASWDI